MLADDAGDDGEVLRRWCDEPADTLNGLCDEPSNPSRRRGLDQLLHIRGAADFALRIFLPERTAVTIRVVRVNNAARGHISEAPRRLTRQRHTGAERP